MASFGTPLRGPAPPPPFVRCLAWVSADSLRAAKSGGAGRSASCGCYLLHLCRKLFLRPPVLGRRGVGGVGARTELFVCSSSPESWIPWHGFSPPSGFPSCRQAGALPRAARGAAWLLRPGGRLGPRSPRAPRPCVPAPERGLGGTAGGGAGCAGCVRKGPKSASGEQTGRKFVLPTLCPRGCRRGKRRRRRDRRPRRGEGKR